MQGNVAKLPSPRHVPTHTSFIECTTTNTDWVALNLIKRNGLVWCIAIMGRGTTWRTLFSCHPKGTDARASKKTKVNPEDLLDFFRNVLLHWKDCLGGHLFLFPPSLFRRCITMNPTWQVSPIVMDIHELIRQYRVHCHNLKVEELDWDDIAHSWQFPTSGGFCMLPLC